METKQVGSYMIHLKEKWIPLFHWCYKIYINRKQEMFSSVQFDFGDTRANIITSNVV